MYYLISMLRMKNILIGCLIIAVMQFIQKLIIKWVLYAKNCTRLQIF
jgi:hypothetical protein